MPALPEWPEGPGPRILTLVGNDLTIDVRARKTASSLARAGFSVISIGVDERGTAPATEILDGALLYRVVPTIDPRVSTRLVRLSRAEIRDWLRYRVEIQRQRLQMARRNLTAWRHWHRPPRRTTFVPGQDEGGFEAEREGRTLAAKVGDRLRRYRFAFLLRVKRARVLGAQVRFVVLRSAYRLAARPARRALRRGSWRRDTPELQRYEAAIGPLVDMLRPDLIHVHDVFHLGLAARAAVRAAEGDDREPVVYDAHEYVAGLPGDPKKQKAYLSLEGEYIRRSNAVVTVSEGLAVRLRARYGVEADVVMNVPDPDTALEVESLRSVVGVDPASPLLLYVGGIAPHRGVEELVQAMALLGEEARLALVTASTTGYAQDLMTLADRIGVGTRVSLAPYVAPEAVVSYLRGATVSVIPLSRGVGNYDVALPNKLFQSIHAGVPVAVSDSPEMARFVSEHGVGEVFTSNQPETIARAAQLIIDNPEKYQRALGDIDLLRRLSWSTQMDTLRAVYARLGVTAP